MQLSLPSRRLLSILALSILCLAPARSYAGAITIIGTTTGPQSTATGDVAFNAQTNTLTFTLTNTSPFDAQITSLGFDLIPGDFSGNSSAGLNGFTGSNVGAFTFFDALTLGNVPQFDNVVLDFGWLTGSGFAGGSPNAGIAPGDSLTFTVTGAPFTGFTELALSQDAFVRFQRVGEGGEGSDVGTPGSPTVVPEPSALILLGSGLMGLAAAVRRRRAAQPI